MPYLNFSRPEQYIYVLLLTSAPRTKGNLGLLMLISNINKLCAFVWFSNPVVCHVWLGQLYKEFAILTTMKTSDESASDDITMESTENESGSDADFSDTGMMDHENHIERKTHGDNIFESAAKGELESVQFFVETRDVPVTAMNADEQTAAHIAARNGSLPILKYLVSKDRKVVHMKDKWDHSVLHQAVVAGSLDIVKYLIDQCKMNPLVPRGKIFGDNCVHLAANTGQLEVLKYLLETKRIDPNVRNVMGESAMFLAAEKKHLEIVHYLYEKHNADPTLLDNNQRNVLYPCAIKGDIEIPKYLLDMRRVPLNVNWQDVFGQTVVFTAARYNQLGYIKFMVEKRKADASIADKLGVSPLREAVAEGHVDIVKYLCENGEYAKLDSNEQNELKKLVKGKELKDFFESIAPSESSSSSPPSTSQTSPSTSPSTSATPVSSTAQPSSRRRRHVAAVEAIAPSFSALPWMCGLDLPSLQIGESRTPIQTVPGHGDILYVLAHAYSRRRDEGQRELLLSPQEILNERMDPNAMAAIDVYYERGN